MMARNTVVPLRPVAITEDSLAYAFADRHKDDLRYDHKAGRWLLWNGNYWRVDELGQAIEDASELCRGYAAAGGPEKELGKRKTIMAVEALARSKPTLATTTDALNADPWLLGTPRGTIDLKTGILREARPQDLISRVTAVAPAQENSECPLWERFLHQSCNGDHETIRFLQRMAGYCLTGDISEQLLFFVFGSGGNGKSVFLETISGIMGDYAETAAMETFTASSFDRHSTELAMLAGARLVTASETEEGRAWAAAKIKQLTGGDKITARFMRQDNFTFRPQFKLLIVGNHRPVLRNVDDAARRRFRLIPFTIKPGRPDRNLPEKLRAEWPQILRWMIDGCLDWQTEGIGSSERVTKETDDYFAEQDLLGQWIEENCLVSKAVDFTPSRALFGDYQRWCEKAGEKCVTEKSMVEDLKKRGFQQLRKEFARGFLGIGLRNLG